MRRTIGTILGLFLLVGTVLAYGEGLKYFARLNYLSGQVLIERAGGEGYEDAALNMPIEEGDRVITADGRAEIYVGFSTYLRLDRNTKMDLLVLPSQGGRTTLVARLIYGRVYLVSFRERLKTTIEVSDAEFRPLEKGSYIIVRDQGYMEFQVLRGYAELRAGRESLDIAENERVYIRGYEIFGPERIRGFSDDFYRWNMDRDRRISEGYSYSRYLPPELSDYGWELSRYGRWRYLPPYGWVWVPSSYPCPDWRPYYYGRWVWVPGGWFWVGYEPWGWVVYHYGRWGWRAGIGWYWIPRPHWSYAWVDWFWFDDYIGWVPIDIYGRPIVIINNVIYTSYDYIPIHSYSVVVVRKDMMVAPNIRRVALRKDQLRSFGVSRVRVGGPHPPLRPVFAVKKTSLGPRRVLAGVRPAAVTKGAFSRRPGRSSSAFTSRRSAAQRGRFSSSGTYRRGRSGNTWGTRRSVSRGALKKGNSSGSRVRSWGSAGSSSGASTKKRSGAVKKKKDRNAYHPSTRPYSEGYRRGSSGAYYSSRGASREYRPSVKTRRWNEGRFTSRRPGVNSRRVYPRSRPSYSTRGYERRNTSFWGRAWRSITGDHRVKRNSGGTGSWGGRSYSPPSRHYGGSYHSGSRRSWRAPRSSSSGWSSSSRRSWRAPRSSSRGWSSGSRRSYSSSRSSSASARKRR